MKELDTKELKSVSGGFNIVTGLLMAAGITFIIGVIDGYVRPLKCN